MDIHEIKKIIAEGESATLEFKTSTANLKSAFETICAYLNAQGGVVLIGVKNDGRILGQTVTDQTSLEIANMIVKLEPPAPINIEYVHVADDRYVIKLTAVVNHEFIPYVLDGKPFWRVGSSTRLMPQLRYQQLLLEKTNKLQPWDLNQVSEMSMQDLDSDEIIRALDESIRRGRTEAKFATNDPTLALQAFGLLRNGKIINAAGVLFGKGSLASLPQCLLRMARFRGLTKSEILDSRQIHGNAFIQLDAAEAFVMRHMSISSEFVPGKMARIDHPEYSLRAIREAMVNAICHRDYTQQNGSIGLMMYDDRLEITSHGTLPRGITLAELKKTHDSFPRNAKITHVMYKRGIIESVGTGTQEMITACSAINAPEPEYMERGATFVVEFYASLQIKDQDTLIARQKEILEVIARLGECQTTQILSHIKNPPTDRTLRADMLKLEQLGYVSRYGRSSRSTTWKLTKK